MYIITAEVEKPNNDMDSKDKGLFYKSNRVLEVVLGKHEDFTKHREFLESLPVGTYTVYNCYGDESQFEISMIKKVSEL